ncbi:MAG: hypothetical protein ABEN55_01000 [Bradymonadaceae bacterium]
MIKETLEALDGTIITRLRPETEADQKKLEQMAEDGELDARHSFADGDKEPLDLDRYEGDPKLGDVRLKDASDS